MNKAYIGILILALSIELSPNSVDVNNQELLDGILKNCAHYCVLLQNAVLDFVCLEEIEERIYPSGSYITGHNTRFRALSLRGIGHLVERNERIYDYQLIKKHRSITETRALLEENGEKKQQKNSDLQTESFWHKNIIMGPIGLLSYSAQKRHEYEIIREERVKGEKTYLVEAVPKSSFNTHYLNGKVWISQNDYSVIRIEWKQESLQNYENILKPIDDPNLEPDLRIISEYTFKKNGLRFPSMHFLKDVYVHIVDGRHYIFSEIIVSYRNYRFFTVETDVKY